MKKRFFLCLTFATHLSVMAQLTASQIDQLVQRTLTTYNVPGIAVAIVKDGQVVHAKGYGIRSIKSQTPVDENTLFGIASNSKAFTSAALAMLVDEGKLKWDDKVTQHIPEFKMYDDYVTQEFTIRDLLTHRSGLGLGAGDLMIWPDKNNFTTQDIIHNLRYLKPVSSFRSKYDYDNLLYIVAGEIIHRVSGLSWGEFIEQRIMKPLEMNHSAASYVRLKDTTNIIMPHVPTDGKLKAIARYKSQVFDPAAGIYSSVADLSRWVIAQLKKGKYGAENKNQLFSERQHTEMWTPQTLQPNKPAAPYFSHFKAYGLGWQITEVKGNAQIGHTGGLDGIVTQVTMLPEINLGIIVLTNQQNGSAFSAITNTIKDAYIGIKSDDYVTLYSEQRKEKEDNADKITEEVWQTVAQNLKKRIRIPVELYTGTFTDNWLGAIELTLDIKGKLRFASKRSPQLTGEMFYYKDQTFAVKWDNRSFLADAFVSFSADLKNIKMRAISPLTDFSYDFQDLDFNKTETSGQ